MKEIVCIHLVPAVVKEYGWKDIFIPQYLEI